MNNRAPSKAIVLAALRKHGKLTAAQLAVELNRSENTVRDGIRKLRPAKGPKLIYIADWVSGVARYDVGDEDDAEGGTTKAQMLVRLRDGGPATTEDLAKALGVPAKTTGYAILRIVATPGVVHISGWKLRRGRSGREAPIWAFGPGKDAPRPDFSNRHIEASRRRSERRRSEKGLSRYRPRNASVAPAGMAANPFAGLVR